MKFLEGKIQFARFNDDTISVNKAMKSRGSRSWKLSTPSPVPGLDVSDGLPPKCFGMIILPSRILFGLSAILCEFQSISNAMIR